jgi:predicted alpha/beta superfamily hydrolase
LLLAILLVAAPCVTFARHRLTIRLELPEKVLKDTNDYYLAADLNNWIPGDPAFKFIHIDNNLQLVIPFEDSLGFQCKITRGSWQTGECDEDGYGAPNRGIYVHNDTIIFIKVLGWVDQVARKHTASPLVELMSDSFPMNSLQSSCKIWIYLPPSYHRSNKHYPVIYMQDGQNLFDRATTAFGTEWKADETMDSIISAGSKEFIIVGISSGEDRLQEYLPYNSRHIKSPKGKEYTKFLVSELVPYVDNHFRTLKGRNNRSIAGSSMGALISLYALMEYPDVFGSAGLFSGAYWVIDGFDSIFIRDTGSKKLKVFLYAGDSEMKSLVTDTEKMKKALTANPGIQVKTMYVNGGQHSEYFWQRPFRDYVLWIQQ